MEEVLEAENLKVALRRVRKNKGSPGVDGMTVEELGDYLREHWVQIRELLQTGRYSPQPVRQHVIPKSGGGVRKLGIPTVLDRFIQQALLQVLQRRLDPTFSAHSYGFRPGRSAHQAAKAARGYVQEGRRVVVDVDLSKFFDRVHHDKLMGKLGNRIDDRVVLGLIRRYLNAGVMVNGVVMERHEGAEPGTDCRGSQELSRRLEKLLPTGRDTSCLPGSGQMDPTSPASCSAQAMETGSNDLPRARGPWSVLDHGSPGGCQRTPMVA